MEISVINIGNSKGIRLSKTILEKYSISDKIELILEKNYIILRPKAEPRRGWEKAFKKNARKWRRLAFNGRCFRRRKF